MSDVRIAQTTVDSKQSQIESDDILIVNGLNVRSQNKTILEDVSFRVKKGTSLAIVGPNGGGKTTVFRTLLNTIRYTGMIKWNGEVRMGYVPQSFVSTDLPILVEEFRDSNAGQISRLTQRQWVLTRRFSDRTSDLF